MVPLVAVQAAKVAIISSWLNGIVGVGLKVGFFNFVAGFSTIQLLSRVNRNRARSRSNFLTTVRPLSCHDCRNRPYRFEVPLFDEEPVPHCRERLHLLRELPILAQSRFLEFTRFHIRQKVAASLLNTNRLRLVGRKNSIRFPFANLLLCPLPITQVQRLADFNVV